MIKSALIALSKNIEQLLSGDERHICQVVYKNLDQAETERVQHHNISWIRPSTVASISDSTNRKPRRLVIDGQNEDGSYERCSFAITRVELDWKIALFQGMDRYYELLPKLFDVYLDFALSFSLQVKIGNEIQSVDVQVGSEGDFGTIPFPDDMEGDVIDDRPNLLLPLIMTNIPVIINSKNILQHERTKVNYVVRPR